MGRAKDWFEGKGIEDGPEFASASPDDSPPDQSEPTKQEPAQEPNPPGWYLTNGTLRYFDGEEWTGYVAPPYPASMTTARIAGAVFLGALAAWAVILILANAAPETFFVPVKFVVEEAPEF